MRTVEGKVPNRHCVIVSVIENVSLQEVPEDRPDVCLFPGI